jgi:hypothetical protein
MAKLVRHRQTKEPETDRPSLKPPRHISPLHALSYYLVASPLHSPCRIKIAGQQTRPMIGRTPIGATESEKRLRNQWIRSRRALYVDRRQVGRFSETNLGFCQIEANHNGTASHAFHEVPNRRMVSAVAIRVDRFCRHPALPQVRQKQLARISGKWELF